VLVDMLRRLITSADARMEANPPAGRRP